MYWAFAIINSKPLACYYTTPCLLSRVCRQDISDIVIEQLQDDHQAIRFIAGIMRRNVVEDAKIRLARTYSATQKQERAG